MGTTDFDSKVVTYVSSVSESTYPVIDSSVIELTESGDRIMETSGH
jgi:hypothetical protein